MSNPVGMAELPRGKPLTNRDLNTKILTIIKSHSLILEASNWAILMIFPCLAFVKL